MTYTWEDFGLDKRGPQFALLDERLTVWGHPSTSLLDTPKDRIYRWQRAIGNAADGFLGPKQWALLQTDPPPPPTAAQYPADIFGLNWKVTVPFDGPDSGTGADEIKQPALATYSSAYCRLAYDNTAVLFTAHHGAPTTSGSKNPRSELREMANQGLNLAKWDGRTGEHRLAAELAVIALTEVKPHTVLMQIHNGSNDVTTLRAEGIKDDDDNLTNRMKLWITNGNNSHAKYVGEVAKGERFTFAFDVADGEISFEFNGQRIDYVVVATGDCFFKLGAYLQSNSETAPEELRTAFTQVALFGEPELIHAA
jgi:hypothetical protein